VLLNNQSYGFTKPKDLWLMNYNGNGSFKAGSEGVNNKNYLSLNISDQAGEGKPWESLMPADGDDSAKNYFTFWEYTSKVFMD